MYRFLRRTDLRQPDATDLSAPEHPMAKGEAEDDAGAARSSELVPIRLRRVTPARKRDNKQGHLWTAFNLFKTITVMDANIS